MKSRVGLSDQNDANGMVAAPEPSHLLLAEEPGATWLALNAARREGANRRRYSGRRLLVRLSSSRR